MEQEGSCRAKGGGGLEGLGWVRARARVRVRAGVMVRIRV